LPTARAALHRLALEILERLPGLDARAVALELAEHARLGDEPALPRSQRARLREAEITHLLQGAAYAAAMYDTLASIGAYGRALQAMGDADKRAAETHSLLADQFTRYGRAADAVVSHTRAIELDPESETAGRGHVHLAWLGRGSAKPDEIEGHARACEALAKR